MKTFATILLAAGVAAIKLKLTEDGTEAWSTTGGAATDGPAADGTATDGGYNWEDYMGKSECEVFGTCDGTEGPSHGTHGPPPATDGGAATDGPAATGGPATAGLA